MVVSMMKVRLEIPDVESIKDKRNIVRSAKEKLRRRFKLTAAETDMLDNPHCAEIGAALVSNDRVFGETVLRKAFAMITEEVPARIEDAAFYSEEY